MTFGPYTDMPVEQLIAAGYRCTSRKWGQASRTDRADWQRVLAKDMDCTIQKIQQHRPGSMEDYYRRVLSRDHVTLRREEVRTFPSSNDDDVGYVDLETMVAEGPVPAQGP